MGLEAFAEMRTGLLKSRVWEQRARESISRGCFIPLSSSQPGAGVKYPLPFLSAQFWALYLSLFIFHFRSR